MHIWQRPLQHHIHKNAQCINICGCICLKEAILLRRCKSYGSKNCRVCILISLTSPCNIKIQ